ncbi:response regulator [Anaerolineae bacterium CFX9]|jgi:CheY-like chemotaxis protein|nr:response regulator [Anaerolineae bacterium CFX9]
MSDQNNAAKVMLVDDDWMNRDLMGIILRRAGFDPVAAHSGEDALELAIDEQPAVVLCDVMMEGMSGYDVCQQFKANPQTAHIPFAILTSFENPEARQKAIDSGADDFITKLIEPEVLISRVRALLS